MLNNFNKKLVLCAALFLAMKASVADNEYEHEIPFDILNLAMINGAGKQLKFYSDIPDDFPQFELPQDYNVLISMKLYDEYYQVVLETTLNETDTIRGLIDALAMEGWSEYSYPSYDESRRGIVIIPATDAMPVSLCHDDLGSIQVDARVRGNANILVLNKSIVSQQNCSDVESRIASMKKSISENQEFYNNGIGPYVPNLLIPPEALGTNASGGRGGSRNGYIEEKQHYRLTSKWTVLELYQHLAQQLREQNWVLDSHWLGAVSTGGYWTLTPESEQTLLTKIDIVQNSDQSYELEFAIQYAP